jgi:hypothetical protein
MGDMTKFNSAIEYYIFNVLLMCLLISEIFIFFYTGSDIYVEFIITFLMFYAFKLRELGKINA